MRRKTIVICGSMRFYKKMIEIRDVLKSMGYKVLLPIEIKFINYSKIKEHKKYHSLRVKLKREKDLIREHFRKIEKGDGILIINLRKGRIKYYIGANTFLEIGYAHYLNKKIFLLNKPSNQEYIKDELKAMDIIILNNDIKKIKNYL